MELNDYNKNFFINKINEKGKKVKKDFEYNSENNPISFKGKKLIELLKKIDDTL